MFAVEDFAAPMTFDLPQILAEQVERSPVRRKHLPWIPLHEENRHLDAIKESTVVGRLLRIGTAIVGVGGRNGAVGQPGDMAVHLEPRTAANLFPHFDGGKNLPTAGSLRSGLGV